jgi:uncharacterized membrane protein
MLTASLSGFSSGTVVVAGILLIVLGVIVLAFAVGGGIAKMIKDLRHTPAAAGDVDPIASLEKLLKALTALLKTLIVAPEWLVLVLIGFGLVGFGAWLIGAS